MEKRKVKVLVFIFYILIYEIISRIVGKNLLLPSVYEISVSFMKLAKSSVFWQIVALSILRVFAGFFAALILGIAFAWISYRFKIFKALFMPLVSFIRSTPVASFIILALLWIKSDYVPVFISFLMGLPIVWANIFEGLENTDKKLLQMAQVFQFDAYKKIKYIYIPQCIPFLYTAAVTSLGFAWKSAVAAEVISMPKLSIGRKLYEAKAYLETPDLFAWTITVVVLSMIAEKGIKKVFNLFLNGGEKA